MRLTRILIVTAMAASSAVAAAGVAAATATPTPISVFTMSRSLADPNTGPAVFDAATAGLTADLGSPSGAIAFHATPTNGVYSGAQFAASITPPTGGALTIGSYTTAAAATASAPGFALAASDGPTCNTTTGSLHITQAAPGTAGQAVTAFAATYTFRCTTKISVSGTLSWQSDRSDITAVAATPSGWDFGYQRTSTDGAPHTFTFVNRGSSVFTLASAPALKYDDVGFRITGGTCRTATPVPSGSSCTVTLVPHPTASVRPGYDGTQRVLRLTPTFGNVVDIPIREEGQPYATTYVQPGPARIAFHWGLQPGPIGLSATGFAVYRGTVGQAMTYYRTVGQLSATTDTAIRTGQPYYYQVMPKFDHGLVGDRSPVIAATAWPVYSAGMYHRLSSSVRFLSSHTVVSGHPYTLQVTGKPGVPTTGVSAVALQITASRPTSNTAVTVYPNGTARPAVPDLTVQGGSARTNLVLARIGSGGRIVLSTSSGYTPVSVDVFGFYSAAGLSTAYGQGGQMHTYLEQGTIMDTKAYGIGALPSGYYIDAPVDFAPADTPHVTSLLVEVTAYGSTSGGTITATATGHTPSNTSVLTYAGGRVTTNVALVAADRFTDNRTLQTFPSISLLNRGPKPVQLIVTILGFVDDNTFSYGERYAAGSALHLLSSTVYSGSTKTINPGSHAGTYTTALNCKVVVGNPVSTTAESLWAANVSGIGAPARPQVRANAHETTVGSTPAPLGNGNLLDVRNTAGQARLDVWSFGRFDYYPQPRSPRGFVSTNQTTRPARPAPGAAPADVRMARSA